MIYSLTGQALEHWEALRMQTHPHNSFLGGNSCRNLGQQPPTPRIWGRQDLSSNWSGAQAPGVAKDALTPPRFPP